MIWFPPAKINLGLQVLRKRPDGYHDISTCFYPVPWTDILEIIPSVTFEFSSSGLEIKGDNENNLCVKAYHLLRESFSIPSVKIHLHKILPMGAGLGGGSSDAAYILKGLNEIFALGLTLEQLHPFAAKIGSDCAFFLYNKPMLAAGKGDELLQTDVIKQDFKMVIVHPGIHVDTTTAYSMLKPDENKEPLEDILNEKESWREKLNNDFEASVFKRYPEIKVIKERLYELGAFYASMSGSGSSVYGLFKTVPNEVERNFNGFSVFVKG